MSKRASAAAAVRRVLPAASVPLRARVAAALAVRNPRAMERARASMRLLLEEACPDADIDAVARRHLAHMAWQNEARWHPALGEPLRVEGLEHLTTVTGGVVVSFLHHGPFLVLGSSLARSGREVEAMATPGLCGPPQQPWERQAQKTASRDCRLFSVAEGSAGIRARVEHGSVVLVASDVPGRTPVTFLGRRLVGSSGAARAAVATGAPVVSVAMHRDPDGTPFCRLSEPLHPADFDGVESLLQELLRRQEPAVLAWPEAYYDPLTKWAVPAPDAEAGSPIGP